MWYIILYSFKIAELLGLLCVLHPNSWVAMSIIGTYVDYWAINPIVARPNTSVRFYPFLITHSEKNAFLNMIIGSEKCCKFTIAVNSIYLYTSSEHYANATVRFHFRSKYGGLVGLARYRTTLIKLRVYITAWVSS